MIYNPAVPARFTFNRELLIRVFFFTAFAFLLYQLFLLAKPFFAALLVSTMLVITFFPIYKRVRRRVKSPNVASLILTCAVLLSAVLPLVALTWIVIRESAHVIPAFQQVSEALSSGDSFSVRQYLPPTFTPIADRISAFLSNLNIDGKQLVLDNIREFTARVGNVGALVARNAFFMLVKLAVLIIALFFTFRDGETFLSWVLHLIPMEESHKHAIAKSAYETFRAVTTGVFLTAAAQGIVAMFGFFIADIRLPVLLGLATGMASLLGASFLVTFPVAIFAAMVSPGKGLFLFIWGAVAVGWLDNFLKPILIGSQARMPFVLVFFSILGGLKMYGLLGIILGPILVASVLAFVRIYREAYTV